MKDFTRWFLRYFDDNKVTILTHVYRGINDKYDYVDTSNYLIDTDMIDNAVEYAFNRNKVENVIDYLSIVSSGCLENDFYDDLWDSFTDKLMNLYDIGYQELDYERDIEEFNDIECHFNKAFEDAYKDICDDVNGLVR
jgi:hypothetical protein